MATNEENFEEVTPKPSAVPPARSRADRVNAAAYSTAQVNERADQIQRDSDIDPRLMEVDNSPSGRATAARVAQEAAMAASKTEEFDRKIRAVPTESEKGVPINATTGYTDNPMGATRDASNLAAVNDPYVPGGLKPPASRQAEFTEEGRAKSEGEKMRSGLDASMTQGLAELNEERREAHNRARSGRITRTASALTLPRFYEHEDLHEKGNTCTKPECAAIREELAAGAVDKDGFRTGKALTYRLKHFKKAHPEVQEAENRIAAQERSEPRNADYVPIDEDELKSKPNLLHLVRLNVVGKWTGLGPKAVRESFSSMQPKQQALAKEKLENEVAAETVQPGYIKSKKGMEGPAFTAPVENAGDWMLGVDSDSVMDRVKGTFDIMRGAHHAAKGRDYDVSRRLGGNKPMSAKMAGIYDRDAKEAAARIAQRELLGETGLAGQARALDTAKYTGLEEAKRIAERQVAVRDAQETRRRGGPGAFRDVPAEGEDPRLESDKARARQAASIARHLPHVLQDMADAHNSSVASRTGQLGGEDVEGPLMPSREEEARKAELGDYNAQGPLQRPAHVPVDFQEVARRLTQNIDDDGTTAIKSGVQGSMSGLETRQVKPRRETDEVVPTSPTPESEISDLREKAVGEANDNIQRVKQLGGRQFEGPLRQY